MKRQILDTRLLKNLVWIGFSVATLFPVFLYSHDQDRWIATSPQVVELLYQLGWGEKLVGAPSGTLHPEEAKNLSSIGNFLSPNAEKILRLKPTKIWMDMTTAQTLTPFKKRENAWGIHSMSLDLQSVEKVFESAKKMGSRTPLLSQAKKNWHRRKKSEPFSFVILAWADPPLVFGENTFLFDLISQMGGTGLLPQKWKKGFFSVSSEWLITQNPDRVFFLNHNSSSQKQYEKACRFWWPEEDQKCFPLKADHFARASLTPFFHLEEVKLP